MTSTTTLIIVLNMYLRHISCTIIENVSSYVSICQTLDAWIHDWTMLVKIFTYILVHAWYIIVYAIWFDHWENKWLVTVLVKFCCYVILEYECVLNPNAPYPIHMFNRFSMSIERQNKRTQYQNHFAPYWTVTMLISYISVSLALQRINADTRRSKKIKYVLIA